MTQIARCGLNHNPVVAFFVLSINHYYTIISSAWWLQTSSKFNWEKSKNHSENLECT